ncbi:hypothetical protein [Portibacter lacus]|uniref:3-oxoacyl-ACP synthase n=1 Tax=Portibacter lacus TaxID=1099794 RepID=A0AA37SUS9_9BACT|nr:hypothetical protein [Portibacter lacus]GLR19954.1 hypothetical protein GCM10007940_45700 [Portibacter lacus]
MKSKLQIKDSLFQACKLNIDDRLLTIDKTLKSIAESKNNETKSSAGDKFETGRAMMQLEEDKNNRQRYEANQVQQVLLKIDLHKKSEKVVLGSLVSTNKGAYFISVGIGKVRLEDGLFYCVSINSPIGAQLLGKTKGDHFHFNGSEMIILEIN